MGEVGFEMQCTKNRLKNMTILKILETSQFEDLIKKRLTRKHLDYMRFDFKDLSRVDPKVLAKGLFENNKLDEVYMKESCLTTAQLEAIFTQIAINPKKKPWSRLDISYNDLSAVHPKIMAKAVIRFKLTSGNPCYIGRFFFMLHNQGLITFYIDIK